MMKHDLQLQAELDFMKFVTMEYNFMIIAIQLTEVGGLEMECVL